MNAKVGELMARQVVTARPHHTVEHLRGLMERNRVSAVPVVDTEGTPIGIVSSTDLVAGVKDGSPANKVMTDKVFVVSEYDDVHIAARVMRNQRIHRVVVTNEQKVVGILSAFDLLKLVEDHRFAMKNPPTPKARRPRRKE
jgi:CBS domain-containing protein